MADNSPREWLSASLVPAALKGLQFADGVAKLSGFDTKRGF
jgi:hypothetical protein